jgi:hypothetical protein
MQLIKSDVINSYPQQNEFRSLSLSLSTGSGSLLKKSKIIKDVGCLCGDGGLEKHKKIKHSVRQDNHDKKRIKKNANLLAKVYLFFFN